MIFACKLREKGNKQWAHVQIKKPVTLSAPVFPDDGDVVVVYEPSILRGSCTICEQFPHTNAFFTLKILKALSCIFPSTGALIAGVAEKSVINFAYFIVDL